MKTYCLWALIFLVLLQAYVAIETGPEFHILSHEAYLKQLDEYSKLTDPPSGIGRLETNEYFNGKNGKNLVNSMLVTDSIMLLLLFILVIKSRTSATDTSGSKKDNQLPSLGAKED